MTKTIAYSIVFFIMAADILAGIFAIEAEKAQSKRANLYCRNASHKASRLGLAAAMLLLFSHVTGNLLGGCTCFWFKDSRRKATTYQQLALASLILSWITVAVGFPILIIATTGNSKPGISCRMSPHHFFFAGGILCFIHGLFTAVYCVFATTSCPPVAEAWHTMVLAPD